MNSFSQVSISLGQSVTSCGSPSSGGGCGCENQTGHGLISIWQILPDIRRKGSDFARATAMEMPVEGYGLVLTALLANIFLTQWMGLQVGKARRKYRVFYPMMYADESENKDAKAFNCVQRGHQNCVEFMPQFLVLLLLGGLQYARVAAFLGFSYTVSRLQYFRGYSTGNAAARYQAGGRFHWFALFGLLLCTVALILHQFFPAFF